MRVLFAVLAAGFLAGCGGSESESEPRDQGRGTLEALSRQPGEDVGLIPGTSDYAPGAVRFSFLVVREDGQPVFRPRARVWIARERNAKPFATTLATLENVGVPGASQSAEDDVKRIYVARAHLPRPGKYWVLAEPVGGEPVQGLGNLLVRRETASPAVGAKAPPSRTPTLASTDGDLEALTTRVPPDRELLRHSIADSVAARKPFVVVFATPEFCTSRTCGPVVDVVDEVRNRFAATDVRFIHVEIYEDNEPALGPNRWVRQWRLPSEPWVFLVGQDGRIKAKFEGPVSVAELTRAVRRTLTAS